MTAHSLTSLLPLILVLVFVISAVRKQWARLQTPSVAAPPAPSAASRRRLAPVPAVRTAPPSVPAAAVRPAFAPSMAQTLPAEAAAAFPALDLSLGELPAGGAAVTPRRGGRGIGGRAPIGSLRWGANAVVGLEILGPPVSLRAGATLGVPHAF